MKLIVLVLALFMESKSFCQTNIWQETSNWRIYNIKSKESFNYSLDTLSHFKNIRLNDDSMKVFLSNVSPIPIERIPVWMGFYIASCQTKNGTNLKLEISTYGGFFYNEKDKKYYELSPEMRIGWLNYFAESEVALQSL
ncbi:MAG TPA: hypothetical protein VK543_11515 [Puia sp.]|nr:hypothetical protein [Puia sp.]